MAKESLSAAHQELLRRRLARLRRAESSLSFAQERFWFLDQLEPDSSENHITVLLQIEGVLDQVALAAALAKLGQRHAALRTTFPARVGVPEALVAEDPPKVARIFAGTHSLGPNENLEAFCRTFHRHPFDLAKGPLWRVVHVALGEEHSALVLCFHHVVTDGWSIGLLGRDLAGLYNAERGGVPCADMPAGASYLELAASQRRALAGERLLNQVEHWRNVLTGAPGAVALPTDRPYPPMVQSRGAMASYRFSEDVTAAAHLAMKDLGSTPYQLFLSLFAAFLGRIGSTEDLVIGTSYAGRDRPGSNAVAGVFVNTLPLRLRPLSKSTFSEVFAETKSVIREAVAHSELPFEKLVSELQPVRDARRTPLFNVFFELRVHHEIPAWDGLVVQATEVDVGEAPFDLTLAVDPHGDRFGATLQYRTDLMDRETVDELWRSFSSFCGHVLGHLDSRLGAAPLVTADFLRKQLMPAVAAPPFRSVISYFEGSCLESGARQAVQDESGAWSYRELDRLSTSLGMALQDWCGNGSPGQPICVALDRSKLTVLVALAVWKAGFAYVPLDMEDGSSRRSRILQAFDSPRLIASLATATWTDGADTFALEPWLELTRTGTQSGRRRSSLGRRVLRAGDLAFVIFTSGSTGVPKGVEVTHGALANHIAWMAAAYDFGPTDRFLFRTPLGFDASLWEVVHPLAVGASIFAVGPQAGRDSLAMLDVAKSESVTVLQTTPSILRAWLDEPIFEELREVRTVVCGSEALGRELADEVLRRWRAAKLSTRLYNHYGPTESCIDSTWDEVLDQGKAGQVQARDSVSVGRAIHGMGALVVDADLEPLPIGTTGELCLVGASLARGYFDDPELTAERFVERELGGLVMRLYRTGDRARLLRDGRFEVLGREDGQVKIRGHRIELGEIQSELLGMQGVRAAEVLAVDVLSAGSPEPVKVLVGFVLLEPTAPEPEQLLTKLARQLPSYMCPAQIHVLESFPLNVNEKVDRQQLASLATASMKRTPLGPERNPKGEVEQFLAATLGKLLSVNEVSLDADFFAMGGHSLLATRLLARARKQYSVELELKQFLADPTLSALAKSIAAAGQQGSKGTTIPRRNPSAPIPLSRAQQRLWLQEQSAEPTARYNMAGAISLRGELDRVGIERALRALVSRHEILRTTFHESAGSHAAVQVVGKVPGKVLELLDLSTVSGWSEDVSAGTPDSNATLQRELQRVAKVPMDLARGPLARFLLLELAPDHFGLLLVMHHILGDGWSFGILASELSALYSADASLPELPIQFADYAAFDAELPIDTAQLAAWRANLAGAAALTSPLELPTSKPRPAAPSGAGAVLTRGIPLKLARAVRAHAQQTGSSLHNTLLASFGALLHHLTGERDLVIGAVLAGRSQIEVQDLLGFFVTALPVRLQIEPSDDFDGLLAKTKEAMGFVHMHEGIGLDVLTEQLCAESSRGQGGLPLFRVGFDLSHEEGQPLAMEGLEVAVIEAHTGWAKLDWNVLVRESASGELVVEMEYATQLFDKGTIAAWFDGWMQLLDRLIAVPHLALSVGSLLGGESKRLALKDGTGEPLPRTSIQTCLAAIEAVAEQTPAAIALVLGSEELTYGELVRAADCIGQRLTTREPHLPRASTIAVLLPRGFDQVITLIGIWKCGHNYMALDPSDPTMRSQQLVQTALCSLVVSHDASHGSELGLPWLDANPGVDAMDLQVAHWAAPRPGDLAYLVPTSGTTGTPKCIEVEHGALHNQNRSAAASFGWTSRDVFLQRIPITFDAAILELITPLSLGAKVVLCDDA
ncbi:MAG: amino acid adenylation domain-containing protein, partial [Planctomycetota bacterium]